MTMIYTVLGRMYIPRNFSFYILGAWYMVNATYC